MNKGLYMDSVSQNIHRLAAFPSSLQHLVYACNASVLSTRPNDTQWSILEHIGHLIEIDRIYVDRFKLLCMGDYPQFAQFSQEDDVRNGKYQDKSLIEIMQKFIECRQATVTQLSSLRQRDLHRVVVDAYFGEITLARLIEILANHDDDHYNHLSSIVTKTVDQS